MGLSQYSSIPVFRTGVLGKTQGLKPQYSNTPLFQYSDLLDGWIFQPTQKVHKALPEYRMPQRGPRKLQERF